MKIYESFQKNSSFQKALQSIKVSTVDLETLLKLIYLDYPQNDTRWAFKQLNMVGKITEFIAKSIM